MKSIKTKLFYKEVSLEGKLERLSINLNFKVLSKILSVITKIFTKLCLVIDNFLYHL